MARTRIPSKRGGRSAYAKLPIVNPGKGLNTLISDSLINDQESSSLDNIQFIESGAPSKAPGYEQLGDDLTNNPRGLGYFVDSNGTGSLLTVDGADLKKYNGSVWQTVSGVTFNTSSQINFSQARGKIYIWDGVGGGASYDGTTLTRPGTMPSAKFSIQYNGYHIAAGTNTQRSRVYISVLLDASDFTNDPAAVTTGEDPDNSTSVPGATVFSGTGSGSTIAYFVDVSKDDGDKITGFAKFADVLIIFKEKSIFQLTFDSTGVPVIEAVTKSYGCVSHRSIENVDNDVFFLTRNGIYVLGNEPNYFNVIRTNELSARIHPMIESINANQYTKATGIFYSYQYILGVPTGSNTANDMVITYDRRFLAFSKWTHVMPESFTTYIDSNNAEQLVFTSSNSAKIYQLTPSTYSADGAAINATWSSKAYDLGDFSSYKRWIDVTLFFRQLSGQVTIEVLTDGGDVIRSASVSGLSSRGIGSDMWGGELFGGSIETEATTAASNTNNVPYRLKIGTKARTIKLRISNDRNNENFALLGFVFTYRNYSHFVFPSALRIQ